MSLRIMNLGDAGAGTPTREPVQLSGRILSEARNLQNPGEIAGLEALTAQLRGVDPAAIDGDSARIAFWANVYNALLLHRLCLRPVRGSMLRQLRLFGRFAYEVGQLPYTLNLIEHGLLRGNRRAPLHLSRPLRDSDPRLAAAVSHPDPRIHFVLNCGARSCPPVRVYEASALDSQLEANTRAYLEAETSVDLERRRIILPRLMRLYAADFGGRDDQLAFAARYLSGVRECRERRPGRLRVRYARFDWTATTDR